MRSCLYLPKLYSFSNVGRRLKRVDYLFVKYCTSETGNRPLVKDGEAFESTKWGYTQEKDGFMKHDKNTTGLYHLGTINLPPQLEKNLNEYLRKFPRKHLLEDAVQLSKHLQNRGRPTERTWAKYKEAKAARKQLRENTEVEENDTIVRLDKNGNEPDVLHSMDEMQHPEKPARVSVTRKPKIQEYKLIRYQKREAAAYIAGRAPATYGATLRVLHEIAKREKDFHPETVLDFGSGVGTATWAAHELWKASIKIYQCVDVSHDMNETAEYLLRSSEGYRTPHYIPRIYFKEYLPVTDKVTYDIVLASYSLSEIPFSRTRLEFLESLWRKTNQFLVIVEKGNNEGFDIVLQARDLVAGKQIENPATDEHYWTDGYDDQGFVFSPCPHEFVCPRSDVNTRDHPCNFEQRVQLSFAQRTTSLKKYGCYNEMFSYVVLRKGERSPKDLDWARLVRPVRLREKHVICDFCSKNGTLGQKILTKRKDSEIYKCVRHRAKWGDLLPVDVDRKEQVDEDECT
ncbi:methyltransferase-like protein 17, mitochondrial [Dendronephthya gigantea]|uniref:methyltransferase-like protein 17, mitochondrial n=1 Tax=Dendronephthya gigantea TaxID=151771 RepID=UPI00106D77C7|nr:methyltransferase-like protein 17, mitochondrial [Dendronephthya gigantea]